MQSITRLLAWRYLVHTAHNNSVSTMGLICFFSTFIGTFSLTLVIAVMSGFELCTHQKLQGIHSPIIMEARGNALDVERIASVLSSDFFNIIKAYAPSSYEQALVSSIKQHQYYPVTIKGIDPELELQVSNLQGIIYSPRTGNTVSTLLQKHQIILGQKLASLLQVAPGDILSIMCPNSDQELTLHIDLHEIRMTIGGIFKTGIEEFDQTLIYCSLETLKEMFSESRVTKIGLTLQDGQPEEHALTALSKRFGLQVYSWKELYPALISALKLEKYAMFFILLLISLVASMNLLSLMCMYIQHKKKDIALLSIYGMSPRDIQFIFITIGVGISSVASALGITVATVVGYCIDHFKLITLPDSYYVSHLPVTLPLWYIIIIFVSSIIISFLASYFSSRTLLKQKPITILNK